MCENHTQQQAEKKPGDEPALRVLADPHLDLRRVLDPPPGPISLDRPGQLAAQIGAEEGTLLKDPGDHPERHGPGKRPDLLGPDRQRSLDALWPPEPSSDPAGPVTFSAKRAAYLNEHVLGEAQIDDGRPALARRLEQDRIRPPVEAGVPRPRCRAAGPARG
jgi:hypothetical protein